VFHQLADQHSRNIGATICSVLMALSAGAYVGGV
jgi:hypothetical protein